MLIRVLAPAAIAILCGATLWQIVRPTVPRLLYNPSPSAPIGWYRLERDASVRRGDRVAVYVPEAVRILATERHYLPPNIPLIKTVWAVGGEEICHENGRVHATGRASLIVLTHDSRGRPLPLIDGCYTLPDGHVFLVSTDIPSSFDSRYFGPVPVSDVLGRVHYLGRWRSRAERTGTSRKAGRG